MHYDRLVLYQIVEINFDLRPELGIRPES